MLSIEKWSIINTHRWIRKAKSILRKYHKARNSPQQEKIFAGLSSSSKTKTQNRRIHHIHQIPSSQILQRRIPTTIYRFYKARQCSNDISLITHINQTPKNSSTILEKTNSGLKSRTITMSQNSSFQEEDSINCPPHHKSLTPNHHNCRCKTEQQSINFTITIRQDGSRYPSRQGWVYNLMS